MTHNNNNHPNELRPVSALAAKFNVARRTAYRWVYQQAIPSQLHEGHYMIRQADLDAFTPPPRKMCGPRVRRVTEAATEVSA